MTYPAIKKFSEVLASHWKFWRLQMTPTSFFRHCRSVVMILGLSVLGYFLASRYVIQSVQVVGVSMYPTLIDSGHYWLDRYSYVLAKPQRDDIVAVRDPQDNMLLVK